MKKEKQTDGNVRFKNRYGNKVNGFRKTQIGLTGPSGQGLIELSV